MQRHIIVNSTNITDYIVDGSYDININDAYESWQDGNMLEHRVIVAQKIVGSFDILCSDETITLSDFITLWDAAVDEGVVSLSVYVPSLNSLEAINAYYKITSKSHIKKVDDSFIDVLTVEIKER